MDAYRRLMAWGAGVGAALALAACGGSSSEGIVARVGSSSITKATLEHLIAVAAAEHAPPVPPKGTLKQHVLSSLISSEWLIGEAVEAGSTVTREEVERRLREKIRGYPDGEAEFHELLGLSGRTVADVKFGIETELASAKVHQLALRGQAPVTPAQIATYYSQNKRSFVVAEGRQVELIHTESKAAAEKAVREGRSGKRIAESTEAESLVYVKGLKGGTNTILARTIFRVKRGVVAGPVRLGSNYFVFEVVQVRPSVQSTLAQVRSTIKGELEARARTRALAAFIKAWRTKWIARTECQPGFVVQKCRQYVASGATPPENPLEFN